jgi:ferritin
MMTNKMEKALNEQINENCTRPICAQPCRPGSSPQNLPGFASWMKVQAREENTHAMKFFDFIHERRGRVVLKAVKEPGKEWDAPLAAFEAALEHEKHITGRINELMNLAVAEKDHATAGFLLWFVKEQVEEEASADRIVQMLKMAANAPGALLMLDHQMGERK